MTEAFNQCATSFGGVYDFYIERPALARLIGRVMWGVDLSPMYRDIDAISQLTDGARILDAPCGGGLALRGVSPEQNVSFVGVDIDEKMLERFQSKAQDRELTQVEALKGDMRDLPLPDANFEHAVSFSGLHMVNDPELAVAELARVLKPGASLVGSSFVAAGSRRWVALSKLEARRGIARPPADAAAIRMMLANAGFDQIKVTGSGFVHFSAVRT